MGAPKILDPNFPIPLEDPSQQKQKLLLFRDQTEIEILTRSSSNVSRKEVPYSD